MFFNTYFYIGLSTLTSYTIYYPHFIGEGRRQYPTVMQAASRLAEAAGAATKRPANKAIKVLWWAKSIIKAIKCQRCPLISFSLL